ncbi:MAG: hypothetical protein E7Z68_02350 [Thermoplasmata archaeon]|nr:hypothetical protein [Thermoplasmata archaeon]
MGAKSTVLAVSACALVALLALLPLASADGAGDGGQEPDATYYRYTIKFFNTSTDYQYLRWDFGDGTVLDGRWEAYAQLVNAGEEVTQDVRAGVDAYYELLEANGGSIVNPVHRYSDAGTYNWSIESYNPMGYVPPSGMAYDGFFSTDSTGYDGGLASGSEEESVRGSYSIMRYVLAVMGYPTVTFDTGGGPEVAAITVENTDVYAQAERPEDPVWSGHVFAGWYTDEGLTEEYDWASEVREPITLHAKWADAPTYDHAVTYRDGGETVKTQNMASEVEGAVEIVLDPPSGLSKQYHTLLGWELNGTVYGRGDTLLVPREGIVLDARWAENTLSFDPVGIVYAYANQPSRITVSATPDPATSGISYSVGEVPEGLSAVSVDGRNVLFTGLIPGDYVLPVSASADNYRGATISVSIHVSPEPTYDHVIVYKDGAEEIHRQIDRNTVQGSIDTRVEQPNASKELHALQGWEGPDGTVYRQGDPITVPEGEIVLTAIWKEKALSIAEIADMTITVGSISTVPLSVSSDPEGAAVRIDASSAEGLDVSAAGRGLTLTASKAGDYTVSVDASAPDYVGATATFRVRAEPAPLHDHILTFMDGEEKVAERNSRTESDGAAAMKLDAEPSKTGHRLRGWSLEPDAETADYTPGETVQVPSTGLTVYTVWEEDTGFDWVPWVAMAAGMVIALLGYLRCLPLLIPVGMAAVALGAVDVLGIFNTFWWWERWQETSPKRRRSQSWPPYCCCRRRSYSTPRKARGRTSSTWSTGPGRRPCRSWRPPPWSSRIPTCSSGPMSTWPPGASRPRCTLTPTTPAGGCTTST